jgi:hypothetical protein
MPLSEALYLGATTARNAVLALGKVSYLDVVVERKLSLWAAACLRARVLPPPVDVLAERAAWVAEVGARVHPDDWGEPPADWGEEARGQWEDSCPSGACVGVDLEGDRLVEDPGARPPGFDGPAAARLRGAFVQLDVMFWAGVTTVAAVARAAPGRAGAAERAAFLALLRCVWGNPFRPPFLDLPPSVLAWGGGTAPKIAAAIYAERAFDRLPILADALEDAGSTDAALLSHCRGPGPHCRGCWAVDWILGCHRDPWPRWRLLRCPRCGAVRPDTSPRGVCVSCGRRGMLEALPQRRRRPLCPAGA